MPQVAVPPTDRYATDRDFTIYSKAEYYADLERRLAVAGAGDRVALMTMSFVADDRGVAPLLEQLNGAAGRGAAVTLAVDAHDFIVSPDLRPGPLWLHRDLSERLPGFFGRNLEALQRLQACGGRYEIINIPRRALRPPFVGRSHIKHAIINDRLYVGGCNLDTSTNIDVMIGWSNQATADWLYATTQRIVQGGDVLAALQGQDLRRTVDLESELLIDAGRRGQSTIFREALALMEEAEESIYMTCQYFPNSTTIKHLQAAQQRGVEVTLIYNSPGKHRPPQSLLHHLVLLSQKRRLPATYADGAVPKSQPFLHAKLLLTEKGGIIGSHNYVRAGVDFGTAEIALLRRSPDFSHQAIQAIRRQLR